MSDTNMVEYVALAKFSMSVLNNPALSMGLDVKVGDRLKWDGYNVEFGHIKDVSLLAPVIKMGWLVLASEVEGVVTCAPEAVAATPVVPDSVVVKQAKSVASTNNGELVTVKGTSAVRGMPADTPNANIVKETHYRDAGSMDNNVAPPNTDRLPSLNVIDGDETVVVGTVNAEREGRVLKGLQEGSVSLGKVASNPSTAILNVAEPKARVHIPAPGAFTTVNEPSVFQGEGIVPNSGRRVKASAKVNGPTVIGEEQAPIPISRKDATITESSQAVQAGGDNSLIDGGVIPVRRRAPTSSGSVLVNAHTPDSPAALENKVYKDNKLESAGKTVEAKVVVESKELAPISDQVVEGALVSKAEPAMLEAEAPPIRGQRIFYSGIQSDMAEAASVAEAAATSVAPTIPVASPTSVAPTIPVASPTSVAPTIPVASPTLKEVSTAVGTVPEGWDGISHAEKLAAVPKMTDYAQVEAIRVYKRSHWKVRNAATAKLAELKG